MLQAIHRSRDTFRARVPQRVPVTWVGVASEVRLVGDFDDWTHGVELSASEMDYDSSMRSLEGVIPLLPVSDVPNERGSGARIPGKAFRLAS